MKHKYINYLILLLFVVLFFKVVDADDQLPPQTTWQTSLKDMVFGNDEIFDGKDIISLETPYRALDAAIVPIKVKFNKIQDKNFYVKHITVVVDENPSPVVGKFSTFLKTGSADISTRVRVDKYTYVRAIAEMSDGKKYMVQNFVKAAGGCSAPSLADMDTVMTRLGKMKMKFLDTGLKGEVNKAKLVISHPNFSGLQFNQLTRTEIPAHFVDSVSITQDESKILEVTPDISLSEDPNITFHYMNSGGPLNVIVTDSDGGKFTKSWPVNQLISKN